MLLSLIPTEESGETRVGTDCLNFGVSLCIHIKEQIAVRGRKDWSYICKILDTAAVQDRTNVPTLIPNVLRQSVRDIIKGVQYVTGVMKKVLSNKKVVQMLCLRCRRKFGRELSLNQYPIIVLLQMSTLICFCSQDNLSFPVFFGVQSDFIWNH